ncbi:hypothetical protein BUALT_Bualt19G0034700 [Buddleja alternifolia]|uniref:Uncharacterized protein n=1 Tax=Buddleja alternifolia TaxID=168488 RepID=A0AAV6W969_9LAMI|nr:hypothetical protein BUALT_Bualt19G0034700 [Buddleja alternifolia]
MQPYNLLRQAKDFINVFRTLTTVVKSPQVQRVPGKWVVEWDCDYGCIRVNGVLSPMPINEVPLPPSPPATPPPPQGVATEEAQAYLFFFSFSLFFSSYFSWSRFIYQPPQSSTKESVRKKRCLTSSYVLRIEEFSLQLLRCDEESVYILETHEIATGNSTFYFLSPYLEDGKRKMKPTEKLLGQRVVLPVTEEVYPDIESKYKLSIKERLEGKWTLEVRQRDGTTKQDKLGDARLSGRKGEVAMKINLSIILGVGY